MKTRIIKIISAVVLFTASVNVFGQGEVEKVCKMDFSKLSIEEIKEIVSNLSPEDQRALLNSTNADCKLLQDYINNAKQDLMDVEYNGQKAVQRAQNGDSEGAACQVNSAFDGKEECKEKAQAAEKTDKQNNSAQKNQIKQDLKNLLDAINEYDSVAVKFNNADSELDNLNKAKDPAEYDKLAKKRNNLAGETGAAANKVRIYAGKIKNNNDASPALKREVDKVDSVVEKYINGKKAIVPASDIQALNSFFENDCDKCIKAQNK